MSKCRQFRNAGVLGLLAAQMVLLSPSATLAGSNPGLTIFGGPKNELNYHLDFGGRPRAWDRYRLRIGAEAMKLAAAQFVIVYDETFTGKFDVDKVEVLVRGEPVPVDAVTWDEENNRLNIFMPTDQPVPAKTKVEIRLSNVKNPVRRGIYNLRAQVLAPQDATALTRSIGTWAITIR